MEALTAPGRAVGFAARDKTRRRYGTLSLEIPIALLVLATLVLRVRATEDLASNPLDPAGLFRVACAGGALLLAGISLLTPPAAPEGSRPLRSPAFVLYMAYVFVVFVGVPYSERPALTAYRGVELVAVLTVVLAAYRRIGSEATVRIERVLYWSAVAILVSVWIGVALFPDLALIPVSQQFQNATTPLPWQISGVFPSYSANHTGIMGALVGFWSIARFRSAPGVAVWTGRLLATFGFVTLVAAQYRTGYLAALVAAFVYVLVMRRKAIAALIAVVAVVALFSGWISLAPAENFVLKGQDARATSAVSLTGRLEWWEQALPVWRESPLIGKGLLTATRFEVFPELGMETTSTIHGTWVEALLGTGVVGVALLASCLVLVWRRAVILGARDRNFVLPLLLLSVLTVRSLTGSSFEIFSFLGLVFMLILMSVTCGDPPTAESRGDR